MSRISVIIGSDCGLLPIHHQANQTTQYWAIIKLKPRKYEQIEFMKKWKWFHTKNTTWNIFREKIVQDTGFFEDDTSVSEHLDRFDGLV